eukprot:scaffold1001_cov169-Amphora_coffeaeformis.AAC.27
MTKRFLSLSTATKSQTVIRSAMPRGSNSGGGVLASHPSPMQQLRQFSKKKKGGGGGGGGGVGGEQFKVYTVWSGDVEDVAETPRFDEAEMRPKENDIQKFIQKYCKDQSMEEVEDEGIQIYNSAKKQFEPLESMEQLANEQKKQGKVFLAPPAFEDDDEDDEEDDTYENDNAYEDYEDDEDDELSESIESVVTQLKEAGWKRQGDGIHLQKDSGEKATTRDLILQKAKVSLELQQLLVARVGALDHMAMCVHFDFVWEPNTGMKALDEIES